MTVIDDVKDRLDIVDYIQQSVPLKHSGRYWKAHCPFHNERTPSFVVNQERQSWHCFGACAEGGDIFDFAMKKHGWSFSEALHELAALAGVELPKHRKRSQQIEQLFGLLAAAAELYHKHLLHSPGPLRYLVEKRGLAEETIRAWQLGWALPIGDDLRALGCRDRQLVAAGLTHRDGRSYFHDRLMIPIRDIRGSVVGFGARGKDPKYLNSPQGPLFDKSRLLFGLHAAREAIRISGTAVIVEGYMDALQAHQSGFHNVVAQMGTALTEAQIRLLKGAKTVILALDGDEGGQKATRRSLEQAIHFEADIRIAILPEGQDPDGLIRQNPERWMALLEQAVPAVDYLIEEEVTQLPPDAPIAEREALAVRLLPLLTAMENNVYRSDNVQKLALHLRIPERELLKRVEPIEKPAAAPRTRLAPATPSGWVSSADLKAEGSTGRLRMPVEAYCLRALLADASWYTAVAKIFTALNLEPFVLTDFSHAGYRQLLDYHLRSLKNGAITPLPVELVDLAENLGNEPLNVDVFVDQTLRLRLLRLKAEIDELSFVGDLDQIRIRSSAKARILDYLSH